MIYLSRILVQPGLVFVTVDKVSLLYCVTLLIHNTVCTWYEEVEKGKADIYPAYSLLLNISICERTNSDSDFDLAISAISVDRRLNYTSLHRLEVNMKGRVPGSCVYGGYSVQYVNIGRSMKNPFIRVQYLTNLTLPFRLSNNVDSSTQTYLSYIYIAPQSFVKVISILPIFWEQFICMIDFIFYACVCVCVCV